MSITLYGMWTSVGKTVSVFLGGLDCGDFTVQTDGSVVVPYGSDPDGLLTALYLQGISDDDAYGVLATQIDVTIAASPVRVVVPCVIGYNYTSEGETLRPMTQEETRSPTGPALGKTRRVHHVGALLRGAIGNANGLQLRSGSGTDWLPAQFRDGSYTTPTNYATMFNGVHEDVLDGDNDLDGFISWRITRPYPVTVCGLSGFIHTQDR